MLALRRLLLADLNVLADPILLALLVCWRIGVLALRWRVDA